MHPIRGTPAPFPRRPWWWARSPLAVAAVAALVSTASRFVPTAGCCCMKGCCPRQQQPTRPERSAMRCTNTSVVRYNAPVSGYCIRLPAAAPVRLWDSTQIAASSIRGEAGCRLQPRRSRQSSRNTIVPYTQYHTHGTPINNTQKNTSTTTSTGCTHVDDHLAATIKALSFAEQARTKLANACMIDMAAQRNQWAAL